jgi:hypothetical protein
VKESGSRLDASPTGTRLEAARRFVSVTVRESH